ncbi:MAG: HipA domain-containing protein, partial [Oxalobacter sp.]|nr:HipA domain-containing protein [Oxalobacter sp.]
DCEHIKPGHLWEDGFTPWLIKFRQQQDALDAGAQEYICLQVAKAAGITTPEAHLFASSACPGWLGVKRFDRNPEGKCHMATVAGLLHCNYRVPCLDYVSLMALTKMLAGTESLVEMLKRAVLNFVLNNCDDHAKNFSFVMDSQGRWQLSPVYDILPDGMTGLWNIAGRLVISLLQATGLQMLPSVMTTMNSVMRLSFIS